MSDTTAATAVSAPEAPPPAAPEAPAEGAVERASEADLNAGFAAILNGREPGKANGKAAPPAEPKPAAETAEAKTEDKPEAPKPEPPEAKKDPPRRSLHGDLRVERNKLRELNATLAQQKAALDAEREAHRVEYERQRQELENNRLSLTGEQQKSVQAALRLMDLIEREPEKAVEILASLSNQTPEDITKRIADRAIYGKQSDETAREIARVRREAEERIETERKAREAFEAKIAKEEADRAEAAKKAESAARQRDEANIVDWFVATREGLNEGAQAVLRQQAENIPFVAAQAEANEERVRNDVRSWIERCHTDGVVLNKKALDAIAIHLDGVYRSEYEAAQRVASRKASPAAPLGAQTVRAPGSANKEPVSASANGSARRVDPAAAANSGTRRRMSESELNAETARILAEGFEANRARMRG